MKNLYKVLYMKLRVANINNVPGRVLGELL